LVFGSSDWRLAAGLSIAGHRHRFGLVQIGV
jgi:hypothetical protein